MLLKVDEAYRLSNQRPHTATHLLHSQLTKIFPNTKQAWSWVWNDELRFDFYTDRLLTQEELDNIQQTINNIIYQNFQVNIKNLKYDEAIKLWAKAFFEDKYWDIVRVVIIWNPNEPISIELCGWTHVNFTSQIWSFVITWQEAVASWIKRITAYTGPKVINYILQKNNLLNQITQQLKVKSHNQILDKLQKELNNLEELNNQIQSLEITFLNNYFKNLKNNSDKFQKYNFDLEYNLDLDSQLKNFDFKKISNFAKNSKSILPNQTFILYKENWTFIIVSNNSEISAKQIANQIWLRWWWNDLFFTWKM